MAINLNTPRDSFSSRLGVIAAAAGSAIGLGNIWRFPYVAGLEKWGWCISLDLYWIYRAHRCSGGCCRNLGLPQHTKRKCRWSIQEAGAKITLAAFRFFRDKCRFLYSGFLYNCFGLDAGVFVSCYI